MGVYNAWKMRNVHKILVGKPERNRHLGYLGVNGRIISQ
jgi:hypothetical protein